MPKLSATNANSDIITAKLVLAAIELARVEMIPITGSELPTKPQSR
jgi:hypothetical protein